ncbi:MAG TPA: chain length determinant protein EpsF [Usitatibacter sp.]|nr:chain length determinant protein EpsF [Usitatibacter sp.]
MNVHQFLLAVRGRLWVFMSLLVATVVAAVIVTLMMPKTYEATVSILVDARDEQSLNGTTPSARDRTGFMQTQLDILQSMEVAKRVVRDLQLAEGPQVQAAFQESGGRGDIEEWIAGGLLQGLKVQSTQSSVINLTASARDPKFAADVANAFAKAYMDTTLHLRTEPNRQASGWFEEQLGGLRKAFEDAQAKLSAYQREKGIIVTDERLDIENARLSELSTQLLRAQDLTYEASSRSGINSSRAADASPEVIANPLIQSLKADVMRAEAKLSELSTRLGPNHPQYKQQASEIAALRARLGGEMSRIVSSSRNATAQSAARTAELQKALAEQRKRVVELRDARNHSFVLQREVETAQKAYEAALARYLVNKVEAGARSTNVTVLNPASEPMRHSKPKTLLNIILGVLVGTVLGLGVVFLLELLDRRVRSAEDLEAGLDAPLLGTLQPWRPSHLLGGNVGGGGPHRALPSAV